jgi:hypothetical protein
MSVVPDKPTIIYVATQGDLEICARATRRDG